nr:hypothetical protein [Myxococcales bacterium]
MIIRGFIALALTSCATDWLPHPAAASDVPAASPRLPLTVPVQAVDAVISGTPGRPELGGGLTLDRPLYRPGETVWTRVWDLGPDFAPGDAQDVSLSLVNVQDRTVAEALLAGVAGGASTGLQLPSSAPGGLYRVRARLGERMLERPFVVQSFVQPQIRKELQLLRDAYGPGDEVVAALSVKSAGAGPLADHAVRVLVQVEGRVAQTLEARTDSEGEATVRFDLPDDMVLPDASVTVLVEEEGWSESVHREVPVVLDGVRIDWFPEGGQLVAGLPGRVYLRATDAHGEPADVAGEVLDDRGRVVSRFASVHDGLGRTAFTPQRGRRYHARLTQPSSDEQQHALPAVEDVGCVLTSYDDPDQQRAELRVGVWCDSARTVVVAGDLGGRSFAPAQVRAGPRAPAVVHLALAEPGPQRQGVAQVTVLSEELRPLAERLVYRNLHRGLSIDVQLPDDGARPGEEVSLTVTTTDPQGRPVPADLAMSVVDDRLLQHADDEHGHLLSQLYLGSWISEQIDDPAWYFDPDEADAALGLDLVLGTVGWRGFRSLENGAGEGTAAVAPDPVPERDVADAETVMLSGVLGHVDGAGGLGLHGAGLGGGGRADGLSGLVGVDNLVAGSEIVGLGDLGKGIGSGRSGYGTGGGNFGARGSGGVARAAEPVVMG